MKAPIFPIKVKKGLVKIYFTPTNGSDAYTVAYPNETGGRIRKKIADLAAAKAEAESIAEKILTGQRDVLAMTSQDKAEFVLSRDRLKPTGIPMATVAEEYAKAWSILGGRSIIEAARYYSKKHPASMARKSVKEVVAEFIESKKGASEDYLADIRYRCGRFERAFACDIASITGGDIRDFLANLGLSPRSQNNFRRSIGTLIEFAKARGYLPKDFDEMDAVDAANDDGGEIEVFSVAEMTELLTRANPRFLPFIAIGGFAGLRSAEIERLDWSEVNLAEGFIEIKAENAKTKTRRLAPVTENLRQWLAPLARTAGPVVPYNDFGHQIRELCQAVLKDGKEARAKITWKANGLRHSFISYRVAQIEDVAKVALEAGNSPEMIFSNYRKLVRPADAAKWWSISPSTAANVLAMPSTATA